MIKESIFLFIGGLGFFFFGMRVMSEGLKNVAGEKLKTLLNNATRLPIIGVLIGAIITSIVQSSSATTVMVVGFVNAGLLALKQGITVIMGANIGTTLTAWLVSSMSVFKITSYALPLVGIGFAMTVLAKTKKMKSFGEVLIGFGILFIGLSYLKDAFIPLKESEIIKNVFATFSVNPILGVLAGLIFTVLLQSSSATIAIVQVLAFNGVISFDSAIPLILGDNIGTTITAQLAAVGTNLNARRVAMSHTVFNVIGVAYMLIFVQLGWFRHVIDAMIPGDITAINIMFYIAVSHSAFNVLNTIIFLPFTSFLEKVTIWLVPQKEDSLDFGTQYLEKHLLETPSLALEQVHHEIIYMLTIARKSVNHASSCFFEHNIKRVKKVIELETITDNLQSEITQYIIDLSQRNLSPEESKEIPVLIHNVNDLERIGDHAQNLAELTRRKIEEKFLFTEEAVAEIREMMDEVHLMFEEAKEALKTQDTTIAHKMLERENCINNLQEKFKQNHIQRLNNGKCNLQSGFIFVEFIDNLEKIADRLTSVAKSVIGKMQWELKQ